MSTYQIGRMCVQKLLHRRRRSYLCYILQFSGWIGKTKTTIETNNTVNRKKDDQSRREWELFSSFSLILLLYASFSCHAIIYVLNGYPDVISRQKRNTININPVFFWAAKITEANNFLPISRASERVAIFPNPSAFSLAAFENRIIKNITPLLRAVVSRFADPGGRRTCWNE